MSDDTIRWLARRCAERGLKLWQARSLLDALWTADVLAQHGGSIADATRATGLERSHFYRMLKTTKTVTGDEES
jgi:hypothetical protein